MTTTETLFVKVLVSLSSLCPFGVRDKFFIGLCGEGDEGIKVVHFIPIGVAHLLAIGDYDARREVAIDVRCKREDVRWIKKHVG